MQEELHEIEHCLISSNTSCSMLLEFRIYGCFTTEVTNPSSLSSYLTLQIPLLVANITIGDNELSKARFKYEKHSISNICTCLSKYMRYEKFKDTKA